MNQEYDRVFGSEWIRFYSTWPQGRIFKPLRLEVELGRLVNGELITVKLLPLDAGHPVPESECSQENDPENVAPFYLIRERLWGRPAYHLEASLKLIRDFTGLEFLEGFAMMIQLVSLVRDYFDSQSGRPFLLSETGRQHFLGAVRSIDPDFAPADFPALSLERIIAFWVDFALFAFFSKGFMHSPDGSAGRPSYLTIPARWIPADGSEPIESGAGFPGKELALVEPKMVDIAERLPEVLAISEIDLGVNLFRRVNDHYIIAYQGVFKTIDAVKGAHYIRYLLQNPYKLVWLGYLIDAVEKPEADYLKESADGPIEKSTPEILSGMTEEQLLEHGLSVTKGLTDIGFDIDEQYENQVRSEIKRFRAKALDHIQHGREKMATDLFEKASELEDFLKKQSTGRRSGLTGNTAEIIKPVRKIDVNRVRKCVNEAKNRIHIALPDLGAHLKCVEIGKWCWYKPPGPVNWST